MPATSKKQFRFMAAVAHGGIKKKGLSRAKAKEFTAGVDYKSLPAKEGATVATETIKPQKKGQKPITFHKGGLHESTGTPAGQKIPASKHAAAASGKLGPKAKAQENFYRNVLHGADDGATVEDKGPPDPLQPVKDLVDSVQHAPQNAVKELKKVPGKALKKAKGLIGLQDGGAAMAPVAGPGMMGGPQAGRGSSGAMIMQGLHEMMAKHPAGHKEPKGEKKDAEGKKEARAEASKKHR